MPFILSQGMGSSVLGYHSVGLQLLQISSTGVVISTWLEEMQRYLTSAWNFFFHRPLLFTLQYPPQPVTTCATSQRDRRYFGVRTSRKPVCEPVHLLHCR